MTDNPAADTDYLASLTRRKLLAEVGRRSQRRASATALRAALETRVRAAACNLVEADARFIHALQALEYHSMAHATTTDL